mmetsp:Transcript_74798/g.173265  ORF Transcript_74798/g.173265 Transcript_74798/m.173265 type:complete len:464 (-) Transcript_74798:82-1473(-)|eukprot:CAMPEP_0171067966 /NCGR_PEP_ID=MMETSP0766_2-20121228/8293_1 /TAXON_ID=439317 /ORGANISM="Gambierdiscus australes, Strain CAWD 149" /LENGTH=463 /DNA_ID=CAMNT_0011524237 /DNA_START=95 /DNA_END=1486 /DNA_ORIENTATION=+
MIRYSNGGAHHLLNLCSLGGSAFPFAFYIALPCAVISCMLKVLMLRGLLAWMGWEEDHLVLRNSAPWNGFSFLVGFLIVFRTSQSYTRFWDACRHTADMRAQWFDAAAALCAFCTHSVVGEDAVATFKHTMVRLFSMLHALALGEMEDTDGSQIVAFSVELLDPDGIDKDSLRYLQQSDAKVAVILQWMLVLIVTNIKTGVLSIPPPILSRVFQQIGNGMVALHQAVKISTIPFPFPYAQACDFLLVMHWMMTPVIIQTWTSTPTWSFIFSFVMVFIFWTLNTTAIGLENPFGTDENDLDYDELQNEMNRHLLVLLRSEAYRPPELERHHVTEFMSSRTRATAHRKSVEQEGFSPGRNLQQVWNDVATARSSIPVQNFETGGFYPGDNSDYGHHASTRNRSLLSSLDYERGQSEDSRVVAAAGLDNEEPKGVRLEVDHQHLSAVVEQVVRSEWGKSNSPEVPS